MSVPELWPSESVFPVVDVDIDVGDVENVVDADVVVSGAAFTVLIATSHLGRMKTMNRQIDKRKDIHTDRRTYMHTYRQTQRQREKQTDIKKDIQTNRQKERKAYRQTERKKERHTDKQAERKKGIQTYTHTRTGYIQT